MSSKNQQSAPPPGHLGFPVQAFNDEDEFKCYLDSSKAANGKYTYYPYYYFQPYAKRDQEEGQRGLQFAGSPTMGSQPIDSKNAAPIKGKIMLPGGQVMQGQLVPVVGPPQQKQTIPSNLTYAHPACGMYPSVAAMPHSAFPQGTLPGTLPPHLFYSEPVTPRAVSRANARAGKSKEAHPQGKARKSHHQNPRRHKKAKPSGTRRKQQPMLLPSASSGSATSTMNSSLENSSCDGESSEYSQYSSTSTAETSSTASSGRRHKHRKGDQKTKKRDKGTKHKARDTSRDKTNTAVGKPKPITGFPLHKPRARGNCFLCNALFCGAFDYPGGCCSWMNCRGCCDRSMMPPTGCCSRQRTFDSDDYREALKHKKRACCCEVE